jgi:hypothetical protein
MYERGHSHRPFLPHMHQIRVREDFKKPILETCEPSSNDSHKKPNVVCETFVISTVRKTLHLDIVLSPTGTQILALGVVLFPVRVSRIRR